MRLLKSRLGVASLVLFAAAGSLWALAAPPQPYFLVKCTKYSCPADPAPCVYPYAGSGLCTQGKNGPGFGQNIDCCCCSGDASNRWFHGE